MIKIPARPISYSSKKRNKKDVKYIVIHYTSGIGDTAENEGMYFAYRNKVAAGAHFFVDQKGIIVKSINLNRIAWSVGGGKWNDCNQTGGGKLYNTVTNANSVSIELCDIATKNPSVEQIDAVRKTIKYIRKHCPNAKTIVRHFDVNGKHCPVNMMSDMSWSLFLAFLGA